MNPNREPRERLGFGTRNSFRRNAPTKRKPKPIPPCSEPFPSVASHNTRAHPGLPWITLDYPGLPWILRSSALEPGRTQSDSLGLGAIKCDRVRSCRRPDPFSPSAPPPAMPAIASERRPVGFTWIRCDQVGSTQNGPGPADADKTPPSPVLPERGRSLCLPPIPSLQNVKEPASPVEPGYAKNQN